jgi:hypothetical protein
MRDIVSFGAEGLRWPHNELQVINNTIVNDYRGRGVSCGLGVSPCTYQHSITC